jgi:hypothetical protein
MLFRVAKPPSDLSVELSGVTSSIRQRVDSSSWFRPTCLPLEPLQRLVILREPLRQKLERDEAMEPRVLGLVYHPHAAPAEFLEDPVMGNGFANHGKGTTCEPPC